MQLPVSNPVQIHLFLPEHESNRNENSAFKLILVGSGKLETLLHGELCCAGLGCIIYSSRSYLPSGELGFCASGMCSRCLSS